MHETATKSAAPLRMLDGFTVADRVGVSLRTLQRMVKADGFPRPVHLSRLRIAWYEHEVDAWLLSRPRTGG